MIDPRGGTALPVVALPGYGSCTTFRPGHHIHPIQARVAWEDAGSRGSLVRTDDGLVFWADGCAPETIATHDNDRVHEALARLGSLRWRISHSLLVQDDGGFAASVARATPLGLCRPAWAHNPKKVFRIGRPGSGRPVRRQRWLCDLGWAAGGSTEGFAGWTGGLAAKLRDLASRGPHEVRARTLDGAVSWAVSVDGDHLVALGPEGERPRSRRWSIHDRTSLAAAIHDSFEAIGPSTVIELEVTGCVE